MPKNNLIQMVLLGSLSDNMEQSSFWPLTDDLFILL